MTRLVLIAALVLLAPSTTLAQAGPIAQATARIDEADFEAAIGILDRAEAGDALSREDLVLLYATRAGASLALGRADDMTRDLDRLSALEPAYVLDASARPELRDALAARSHQPLRLDLAFDVQPGAATIRATVAGDPGGLAREIHLRARVVGTEAWTERTGDTLVVPATDAELEYWGEIVGPGGAIVARAGSAASPSRGRADAAAVTGTGATSGAAGSPDLVAIGVGVGAGVAVVAILVVIIAVVATSGSSDTQPGLPHIVAF